MNVARELSQLPRNPLAYASVRQEPEHPGGGQMQAPTAKPPPPGPPGIPSLITN